MHLRLIWIGKTKNKHLRALITEYLARLEIFVKCEVVELRESPSKAEHKVLEDEGRNIIGALRPHAPIVLLDTKGQTFASEELASKIDKWQLQGTKELIFIVGGHYGVSPEVEQQANVRWCLSELTFTHEIVRVLLVEQLYRAYTIIRGLPYHK
jgi:23S rRNA (pseudouridine1915-N3)-methyltransferase